MRGKMMCGVANTVTNLVTTTNCVPTYCRARRHYEEGKKWRMASPMWWLSVSEWHKICLSTANVGKRFKRGIVK